MSTHPTPEEIPMQDGDGHDLAIRVRGLVNRFGSQTVHEDLDLEVRRGEILGVVGGSGTGKSVLMRSILGLRTPDEGEIEVLGVDARSRDPADRRHIERNTGVLFQDGALFSSLTVGENVQVPLKEHHRELPERWHYELALLKVKLAGLPADAINKLPSQLSGGMRKRAGLARALALDPPLMIYDEPLTGLDPIASGVVMSLVRRLNDTLGLTSVVVTHHVHETLPIADHAIVLANGGIVFSGTPAELEASSDPFVRQFLTGAPDGPIAFDAAPRGADAVAAGAP